MRPNEIVEESTFMSSEMKNLATHHRHVSNTQLKREIQRSMADTLDIGE